MQLTHYTDYSLRVLLFLALQESDHLVTINVIAEHFAIPRNHLIKVVQRLAHLGYVETVRGKGGGLRLNQEPQAITIGAVVRAMETKLDVIDCQKPPCPLRSHCGLKTLLNRAQSAFLEVLDDYTLADLRQQPQQIQQLLHWHPPASPS